MGIEPITETLQVFLAEALEHASPFEREKGFEPSTASLEGWNSTNWATPAGVMKLGTSPRVYVNGVIKPANDTSVGFYEKPSLQNASFYRPETE